MLFEPGEAIWQSLFQAVSAFNNAGFVILPDSASLSAFQDDRALLGATAALIFLGAIGYWVILDVIKLRRFSLLPLNTKLVIIMTGLLVLFGALVFYFSETDNTLSGLSVFDKALVSVFESISGRTAGFSTIDYGATKQNTNFFFTAMMFVGGASGICCWRHQDQHHRCHPCGSAIDRPRQAARGGLRKGDRDGPGAGSP